MSWRSILISKGGKLSLKQNQLCIWQEEAEYTIPIEDIAIIVIESKEVVITTPLLSALALNGVTLLTCDQQYLPCGQWLPFSQYHRQLKILKLQFEATIPQKKQLWQEVIKQKVLNQSFVLSQIHCEKESEKLQIMAKQVKSGDKENIEAQAALLYFQTLFGKTFRRTNDDNINSHLNYAYSILRSAIARRLVYYGWLPSLGIFHHSELNPFNLADDFIEPFRPLVDLLVWELRQQNKLEKGLTPYTKQQLIKTLHKQIQFQNETLSVLSAIDRTIASLKVAFISKNAKKLKLPTILPLEKYHYE
ncbi:type II CRISPR-associated endonuclease Cas1 [Pasteurella skyensis]|uniref:CRISPR-associated endonuclease Cas1 n=1 Tax=Phocoenobacter skyensis TaxID=97481 RepID=A0AAJ6NAX7_9PAST|nr:type II CRISPR-associated endonuclease Cas1 [Pasteurella skyensis]MDP8162701.1 type II CRISPR-associated endonuclease Cas1 [Pasteurella skyensis]MDP8173469.1 type II CRISPR-associated endonuclease Cas1 [Pasteurella skyensis]MDP8177612.1 type II CRISPR-associated endonuclease Cas1 [Pasteurella skyensis]MDP8178803.1 type II CRISPR-associated endonuclease Cas1 [Pasteurella skyensis]MDP8183103.1 type II CRISPR-associated endonuclease Cas1 [Pasteurella skyensis]